MTAISGNIVSRAALASALGFQYGTDRDIYQALGYPTEMTFTDYAAKYIRQDVAKAIIDRPVLATWKGGFNILETDDKEKTPLEKEWKMLEKQLLIRSKFVRLDKLTGLGRYGVLLLGLDDVQNINDFGKPVTPGKRKLLYVKPLGEKSAEIISYDQNPPSERYGLPLSYNVTIAHPTSILSVHYSRIIHITDGLMESEVLGTPRLEVVFNRLMDLEKLIGGSAEMFWRGARPGYQGKVDPEFMMTQDQADGLQGQIDEFENNLRRILINEGVDLKELAQQIADPSTHVDVQIQMISMVTGIPKRILTGSERGELSSSQDLSSWLSLIGGRRTEFAEPNIIFLFVDKCIELGVLPSPKEKYSVEWASLYEESDKDKAEVGKIRATALKEYVMNPMAETVIPPDAFYRFFLGLSENQIELIEEMQKQSMLDLDIDEND